MTLSYLTGDATQPILKPALIMHVCNDIGAWGRGFVLAVDKISPRPRNAYSTKAVYGLGEVQFVPCAGDGRDGVMVANMIAQHDIRFCRGCGEPPIRYDALARCLEAVFDWTRVNNYLTIHAPRLGSGLAGGDWVVIEALIEKILKDRIVYIYDLPETR